MHVRTWQVGGCVLSSLGWTGSSDFVDYEGKHQVEGLPNWTIEVFQTGALPHFEQPQKVVAAYEDFVHRAVGV